MVCYCKKCILVVQVKLAKIKVSLKNFRKHIVKREFTELLEYQLQIIKGRVLYILRRYKCYIAHPQPIPNIVVSKTPASRLDYTTMKYFFGKTKRRILSTKCKFLKAKFSTTRLVSSSTVTHLSYKMLNEWDIDLARKEIYGHHLELGSVRTGTTLLFLLSVSPGFTTNYVFSLVALNSFITFSYTTNVREAAGRFFSRLDVMPL